MKKFYTNLTDLGSAMYPKHRPQTNVVSFHHFLFSLTFMLIYLSVFLPFKYSKTFNSLPKLDKAMLPNCTNINCHPKMSFKIT